MRAVDSSRRRTPATLHPMLKPFIPSPRPTFTTSVTPSPSFLLFLSPVPIACSHRTPKEMLRTVTGACSDLPMVPSLRLVVAPSCILQFKHMTRCLVWYVLPPLLSPLALVQGLKPHRSLTADAEPVRAAQYELHINCGMHAVQQRIVPRGSDATSQHAQHLSRVQRGQWYSE
ncbi:hypothetical protein B0J11DRAFT_28266 [Dendryphion nanum]|uniref:Uncharacterized protein n=1 Tax=Dendryphion nanum TaxID=256645 RepID=A0A9P9EKS8_9PLEO|nr:hypothetical protein B0J11DRAFT_28266 [Dendryphion nanum]